jgi:hypothetical protein
LIEKGDKAQHMWEKGWEGHERAQLLRMARLSFEEKIRWLEEIQNLIQAFEQNKGLPLRNKNFLCPQN